MNGGGRRDPNGRFCGSRLHVEAVPRLPTFPARWALEDPRRLPYFVFWVRPHDGLLSFHVRMVCLDAETVRLSTPEGTSCEIRILRRPMPRHGGHAILYLCPQCGRPQRYLYGVVLVGYELVEDGTWRCHRCARLLFHSQGHYRRSLARRLFAACYGALRIREPLPRRSWDPRAVSHPGMVMDEFPGRLVGATAVVAHLDWSSGPWIGGPRRTERRRISRELLRVWPVPDLPKRCFAMRLCTTVTVTCATSVPDPMTSSPQKRACS